MEVQINKYKRMPHININTILLKGSLNGPRKVDMGVSRNCIMFVIPRGSVSDINEEALLHQHCFYVLLGNDEDGRPKAYIGQSFDFTSRVKDHLVKKEFWDIALVFVSKTDEIFQSEVAYLEYCGITAALNVGNFNLDENKQVPKKPKISAVQEGSMDQFFADIRLLTRFYNDCYLYDEYTPQPKSSPKKDPGHIFNMTLPSKGVSARFRYIESGGKFILLKGSVVNGESGHSLRPSIAKLREDVFKMPVCTRKGKLYVFQEDFELPVTSPSSAAVFCAGTSRNGATDLVDESGKLFKELFQS